MPELVVAFSHAGYSGSIAVSCVRNDDPGRLGCRPQALDFPACTATVAAPAQGYRAMFGWVQLVKSSDNRSAGTAFEMDPFALFAEADSPYAFYGYLPTLFDGPSRLERHDMDWLAHSFLAATPFDGRRKVVPLAGFSWGFEIRRGDVALKPLTTLSPVDWRAQLPVLEASHPRWTFDQVNWPV